MKLLFHIWLVLMVLAGILVGCNRAPKYDQRLVAADKLVYEQPDKAKEILSDIKPLVLNEPNAAYYNLLLTQASYIGYDEITPRNDSIISAALDYYSHNKSDKEKLTRSMIFKGAVLQLLGVIDTSMIYYKNAELNADKDDDFNRGYAQMRMGNLYKEHNAYDGRDLEKYEEAVKSFRKCKNNHYLLIALRDLGALYRYRKADKAEEILKEAIALAEVEKDTSNYLNCVNLLAYFYNMQRMYDKAYNQLQRIKSFKPDFFAEDNGNAYSTFATVYANIGKVDSAEIFLNLVKRQNDDYSLNYLIPKSQICKARGDMYGYYKFSHITDSLDRENQRNQDVVKIMHAELNCDEMFKSSQATKERNRYMILATVILTLLLLALLFYRRSHRYDKLVLELKDRSQSQINDLTNLQDNINELKINDERLKGFILSHMGMMREMIDACYHEPNNRIAENMKRIVKFQDSNRDNWVRLYDYIDLEHNNIMARTRENYPQLNDRDLLLLALTCMGFSYIQTAIIMGYSNATSVSVIKQRLAKKMGLECTLNEYIDSFSQEKTASDT